jgi:hypothetical protein
MARRKESMEKTPVEEQGPSVDQVLKLIQGLKIQADKNPALM